MCRPDNICGENEGICDNDNGCQEGLKCGVDNCDASLGNFPPSILGNASSFSCCYNRSLITNLTNGDSGFCTINHPCSENEGQCDSDMHCMNGLKCGTDNCHSSLGFDSTTDCCFNLTIGDLGYCTTDYPCAEDEGDCDNDDQCIPGFVCGVDNCKSNFTFSTDCCEQGMAQIITKPYKKWSLKIRL